MNRKILHRKNIVRKTTLTGLLPFNVFLSLFLLLLTPGYGQGTDQVTVTIDRSVQIGTSHFNVGVTHTGERWENGDPKAVARGKKLLSEGLKYQNQHIMNWGTGNPEPSPGVYDWTGLDKRINLIRSMHAIPIITLCSAPGWMNTTGEDEPKQVSPNHWRDPRVADDHVNDFAELCKQVALRYKDVRYFQVWNEFKGYWSDSLKGWDYIRYTNFYNAVYDAVKSVRPDAQLGGPYYTGLSNPKSWTVIDYWLQHKHGADFVCFDGWIAGYPPTSDTSQEGRKMGRTDYFGNVVEKFRERTDLPVWISEFYGGWSTNPQFTAANHASCYLHSLLAGASVALLWSPASQKWNYLFTSTKDQDGGQASPHYQVVRIFNQYFGPGTKLYKTTSSSSDVEVLASETRTLLINKQNKAVDVLLNGRSISLVPYDVRLIKASKK
jgi:hypothetical protein